MKEAKVLKSLSGKKNRKIGRYDRSNSIVRKVKEAKVLISLSGKKKCGEKTIGLCDRKYGTSSVDQVLGKIGLISLCK